ncbi:Uncharacterised protein [Bordetella pertussis]|nr:Uncharacterised protein [Bordetella pertussis]
MDCSHHCTPCSAANARSTAISPSVSGSRWRNTSTIVSSPNATSIWGMRSGADMAAIMARRGSSRRLTAGGSTWHSRMSAT